MVTLRVNIVALILAAVNLWIAVRIGLNIGLEYKEMAFISLATFAIVRAYDWVAGLAAFKGGGKKKEGK